MKFEKYVGGQFVNIFQFSVWFCATVWCVKINKLQVPEVAHPGRPIILDCDYTLEESLDQGLVLKWFFNDMHKPVYQWIPTIQPKVLGILRGRLNLSYSASKDLNSVHRALHIIHPGPDLSGNYTCLVSTVYNEDQRTKKMIVLVPEKSLELSQRNIGNGSLQVICYAVGVFPKPDMNLLMGNSEVNNSELSVEEKLGLFDIRTIVEMPALTEPKEFSCELRVPQANYTVVKKAIYYPVNLSTSVNCSEIHLILMILTFHFLFILW